METDDDDTTELDWVRFEDHASAQKAVDELDGKDVNGKPMCVAYIQHETVDLNTDCQKLEDVTKNQNVKLIVKNFGEDVTENKLLDLFRVYGKVVSIKVW